jgi:cystatin-A/B
MNMPGGYHSERALEPHETELVESLREQIEKKANKTFIEFNPLTVIS